MTSKTVLRRRASKVAQHVLHLGAGERIERAEGLVHQEDRRVGGEGAGQADALALASGELMRIAAAKTAGLEADRGEQLEAAGIAFCARAALSFKHQASVALDGEMREEAGLLDHITDAAAQCDEVCVSRWSLPAPARLRRWAR